MISLLVAILTLFSGFGLSTLLLPIFSIFFSIEIAIAATAIVHLVNNIFKFFLVGRMANLTITMKFAIPAAITAALGAWLLTQISGIRIASYQILGHVFYIELIKMVVGILIGIFVLLELVPKFSNMGLKASYIPLGGAISGFFGGLSGLQGALRSMFLLKAGLNKNEFIGTTVVSAIIVDLSRLVVYGFGIFSSHLQELKNQNLFGLVTAATISACVGSIIGTRVLKKITLKMVETIVGILLFMVAICLTIGLI